MNVEWYYTSKGQRFGPVSAQKLKELADLGELAPTDFVWKEGMTDWVAASNVKGLFRKPSAPQPPPIPEPPRRPIPVEVTTEVPVRVVSPSENVGQVIAKWVIIGWSLFCLLGVCAGILNVGATSKPTYNEYEAAGGFIGLGCGLAIWLVFWAVIAGPAMAIWLLMKRK